MAKVYKYHKELDLIIAARKSLPKTPAKTLAKQLVGNEGLSSRSFYSIYSVIRRYDAKLAGVVSKALATV